MNYLGQMVQKQALHSPEAPAISAPGKDSLCYAGLHRQVVHTVEALNGCGIGSGDRVAVVLPNGPKMAVAFLGVAAGAVCAPLNPSYQRDEFDFYLDDLRPATVLVQADLDSPVHDAARKRQIPVIEIHDGLDVQAGVFSLTGGHDATSVRDQFVQSEDVALILYTSGTTSRPKRVPLTHANLMTSAQNVRTTLQLSQTDVCLNVMPLFHIHGLVAALLGSLCAGGHVICTPGFDSSRFWDWMEQLQPTWYSAVPTIHQAILSQASQHPGRVAAASLRFIRSSSAALPPVVMERLERAFGVPVLEAYGMTEAAHQMTCNPLPPQERKSGSVGIPAGPQVVVLDSSSTPLVHGVTGEIAIRGANVTPGYENNPTANEQAFTNSWFRTGDQGHFDSDGYLYITGRLKELINRGGEKIAPREIDEILLQHPSVSLAVTFSVPHPTLQEDVAAAVVLAQGESVETSQLQNFVAERLADFKVPRQIIIVDEIPKGPTGKIQRIDLAEQLGIVGDPATENAGTVVSVPRNDVEKQLFDVWCQVLGVAEIGIHASFFSQLGGDSITATQIASRVRDIFGCDLSISDFFGHADTVAGMAQLISSNRDRPAEVTPDLRAGDSAKPRNRIEAQVAQIWAEILERDEVGTADDFFELGGDSLVAMRMIARILQSFGIQLSLRYVFDYPTVADISEAILADMESQGVAVDIRDSWMELAP